MTPKTDQMREVYPAGSGLYRYQTWERAENFTFELEGQYSLDPEASISFAVEASQDGRGVVRTESGSTHAFAWAWVGAELHLWLDGDLFVFEREESRRGAVSPAAATTGDILAPMPGSVLEVLVKAGDRVESNQTLVIMESMKMELVISAPSPGIVQRVAVEPGQRVERGMRLLEVAPGEGGGEDWVLKLN